MSSLNRKLFLPYLDTLGFSLRFILFEKYKEALMLLWWGSAAAAAFVLKELWTGGIFIAPVAAFVLQKRFYRLMGRSKSRLIRIGDSVEYAHAGDESCLQIFKSAKVLRKMRVEDAARTGLFPEEMLALYSHFYLVDMGKKNAVIPYEWILSIDPGELPD